MKALVTGATGFVGSHLVDALRERGDEVTALVRSPAKAAPLKDSNVHLVSGDLQDHTALDTAVAGQDVIYHVAGRVTALNEAEFFRSNRDGTANLVLAARRAGGVARFVLVSSLAAAGPSRRNSALQGDEPPQPVTQYGRSKLAAEELVRTSDLAWCILRPPVVYGPRDKEVLKLFKLARTGLVPVFGDGRQELSAVFAPDLAGALVASALSGATIGGTYYPSHRETFTSAELVRAVGQAVGRKVRVLSIPEFLGRTILTVTGTVSAIAGQATILTADKANEFFQPAWTGDPGALTRDTGWSASHDLASGLAITASWYREAGWL